MVPHNIFMENLMGARNTLLGSPMVAWITFRDKPSLSQNTLWENPRITLEKTLGFAEHALGYP